MNEQIKTHSVDKCIICNSRGSRVYEGMHDLLFGTPGLWSLSRCPKDGLIWINPQPNAEDIEKLYSNYYTHSTKTNRKSFLSSIKNFIVDTLITSEFGYEKKDKNKVLKPFVKMIGLLPGAKDLAGSDIMWLDAKMKGDLLDVGCGNGGFLVRMRNLGWDVVGIEPDTTSAILAKISLGEDVAINGSLSEVNFKENSFDAITAHHVIEHVSDPKEFLNEIFRILRPGGKLVITTINTDSFGHQVFKHAWRGLEVPRHLYLGRL